MEHQEILNPETILPPNIHIIPLQGKPLFPGFFLPVIISDKEEIKTIDRVFKDHRIVGFLLTKEKNSEEPHSFFRVGVAAKIIKKINLPDNGVNIFISVLKRFRVKNFLEGAAPLTAAVEYLDDIVEPPKSEIKALTRALLGEMKTISENNSLFSEEVRLNMVNIDNPGKIADFITSILNISRRQQQLVLEMIEVRKRMEQVLIYIKKEQELLQIQKRVTEEINERIEKNQREYFLREELKAIKKELGEPSSAKDNEYLRLKEKIENLSLGEEAEEKVGRELEKMALMDASSSEYIVTRNYLDTIVGLPWETPRPARIDLEKSRLILNEDHYGIQDVKTRILEYLSVLKLKDNTKGAIICLVGPPGVGKTSVGRSVARALGRKFFRFSVGGMRDEAEIKGHRRTYVGAMPGKIIQGLKTVKEINPVFMLDEIDKLGSSFQGDPSSALLEVLDPEQNATFRDHYLDIPYDLSHIFFIATANTLDSIPRPLLDRMEIIRLSGYIMDEKLEIAKQYIIPRSLKKHGLLKKQIRYRQTALKDIAEKYARDAGMRSFEKAVDRIHRKVAYKVAENPGGESRVMSRENLEEYLGPPVFREDVRKQSDRPGLSLGLAWTNFGGDVLSIEALAVPGKEGFKLTGRMGEVMKESASIAYTYVHSLLKKREAEKKNPDNRDLQKPAEKSDFFNRNTVHLHIPEGATPKDGPSAGITMAVALFSLAQNRCMKSDLAMTGELSLTGQVLPIGGLKEKVIAAKRYKVKEIIFPAANERDLKEIPDYIRKGLKFHPVKTLEEVFRIAFPG